MPQNMNQFSPTPVAGDVSLPLTGIVTSGQIAASELTQVIPGQALKLDTSAAYGGVPKLLAMTSDNDPVYCVAIRNLKNPYFVANDALEIAQRNTYIWMTCGAAMNPGTFVRFNYSTKKIVPYTSGNYSVVGQTLDKSTADGDLVRVLLQVPEVESASA